MNQDLLEALEEPPIIRRVNNLLKAISSGQPNTPDNSSTIGFLIGPVGRRVQMISEQPGPEIAANEPRPLILRLKIMAGLDIAVSDQPQTGYIKLHLSGILQTFRATTTIGPEGESIRIESINVGNSVNGKTESSH